MGGSKSVYNSEDLAVSKADTAADAEDADDGEDDSGESDGEDEEDEYEDDEYEDDEDDEEYDDEETGQELDDNAGGTKTKTAYVPAGNGDVAAETVPTVSAPVQEKENGTEQ